MIQRITLLRCDRSVIEEILWFNETDRYIGTNTGAMPFTLSVQSSVNETISHGTGISLG